MSGWGANRVRLSLSVKKILRTSPHKRPRRVEKSPRPRFHAATKRFLQQMRGRNGGARNARHHFLGAP